jgi:hypothetical protein
MLKSKFYPWILTAVFLLSSFGTFGRIFYSWGTYPLTIGYFTVQSNLMVVIWSFFGLLNSRNLFNHRWRVFLHRSFPGLLLYISITGLVYNLLLAGGGDSTLDNLLLDVNHTYTPILFLFLWFLGQQPRTYTWKDLPLWLIYPILYLIFGTLEGKSTGSFRYYFLDYRGKTALLFSKQIGEVVLYFLVVGTLILVSNRLQRSPSGNPPSATNK